jgi:hypothetical protein
MLVGYDGRAVNTSGHDHSYLSIGGYDGTNQATLLWRGTNDQFVPTTGVSCAAMIHSSRMAAHSNITVEATSFNADGFTAYSRGGNAGTLGFMLLDSTFHIGNSTYATSGAEQYTGASAKPMAAIELSSLITGALDTRFFDSTADGYGIAVYDDTSEHVMWLKDDDGNNVASDAGTYLRDAVVDSYLGDDSAESRATFSSFLGNGRSLSVSDYPAGANRYVFIGLGVDDESSSSSSTIAMSTSSTTSLEVSSSSSSSIGATIRKVQSYRRMRGDI